MGEMPLLAQGIIPTIVAIVAKIVLQVVLMKMESR